MMGRGYGYGYGMDGEWLGGIFMLLLGAVVVVGIVLLVIWAVRSGSGHNITGSSPTHPGEAGHHEAVAIVKRRFASGEVTKEQYDEIMRTLGG
jgi:uncharacterized membrane protein